MHQIAPKLIKQDLCRGRQCYGFEPVSKEVQYAAIERAYELGIRSHRIFDMMNDITNLEDAIEAAKEVNLAKLPKALSPTLINLSSSARVTPSKHDL